MSLYLGLTKEQVPGIWVLHTS